MKRREFMKSIIAAIATPTSVVAGTVAGFMGSNLPESSPPFFGDILEYAKLDQFIQRQAFTVRPPCLYISRSVYDKLVREHPSAIKPDLLGEGYSCLGHTVRIVDGLDECPAFIGNMEKYSAGLRRYLATVL